jgi:hypothetical protein
MKLLETDQSDQEKRHEIPAITLAGGSTVVVVLRFARSRGDASHHSQY